MIMMIDADDKDDSFGLIDNYYLRSKLCLEKMLFWSVKGKCTVSR